MKVGIIYGGTSSERLPSEKNAKAIGESLLRRGHSVRMIPYDENMLSTLQEDRPEIVFLCVQGKYHGDGTLQAILDFLHIPYTGSPTAAAALINDKLLCKIVFAHYGHATPPWYSLRKQDYEAGNADFGQIGYPFVAKAPTQGGSFGISLIRSPEELSNAETAFQFDDPILAEGYVDGEAYTIGILETDGELTALPCVKMLDRRIDRNDGLILMTGDYAAEKADLSPEMLEKMKETALAVYRETGARDYARIDFMTDREKTRFFVIEINAVPGLKPSSLYPLEAAQIPIDYDDLIEHILLNAGRRAQLC